MMGLYDDPRDEALDVKLYAFQQAQGEQISLFDDESPHDYICYDDHASEPPMEPEDRGRTFLELDFDAREAIRELREKDWIIIALVVGMMRQDGTEFPAEFLAAIRGVVDALMSDDGGE